MNNAARPLILSVDDDNDTLNLIERLLTSRDYRVITANSGAHALQIVNNVIPNLILLDVIMPEMDGFEVCSRLQGREEFSYIPVIFVTSLKEEQDKAKAFSVGAVDYMVKPIQKETLFHKVDLHLNTNSRWEKLRKDTLHWNEKILPFDFVEFKEFLTERLHLQPEKRDELSSISFSQIYSISSKLEITDEQMAKYIAQFLKFHYLPHINPENVQLGLLPTPFCRKNVVIPILESDAGDTFALSNPFNWELLDLLEKFTIKDRVSTLAITEPDNIASLFNKEAVVEGQVEISRPARGTAASKPVVEKYPGMQDAWDKFDKLASKSAETRPRGKEASAYEADKQPVMDIFNDILEKAASERASDIHIEPKETETLIRLRIDGDMRKFYQVKKETGAALISRLKVLGGMDIAERRKPQDGACEAIIDNRNFRLRMATTSTPNGESLIIRVLEPGAKPRKLHELGMIDEQADIMVNFASRSEGLILIVGATGSGKSTTSYSLLSQVDCEKRSLISVEDPVEYRIALANQQQVNEKAGVTFESLLKSSVRQDPDILFLGEIRDEYSARIAVDFASTGHLTISTLHTSNATTAIFRLERLNINRGMMADSLLGIVAQKLLKKLCPHCKEVALPSQEEIDMLAPFSHKALSEVARASGCSKCNQTGYHGREGVYEIVKFDPEISEMVRHDKPISEIREFMVQRGDYLISHHAVEKVKKLLFTPKQVYERVLIEEEKYLSDKSAKEAEKITVAERRTDTAASILIVEDDQDTRTLLKRILENRNYNITLAEDGVDALLKLGSEDFNLILSDINMPNLDGFKLLEMVNQKGIKAPVIFLTGQTRAEYEAKGLKLGATDYITKPVKKEVLLLRIQKVLESDGST